MSGEIEAAGDALTGGLIARAVTGDRGTSAGHGDHGACLNCGAPLTTPYCGQCGQGAHLHRTLSSLGHDILHGVFHFEGKVWRTLPELILRPGHLTRRYVKGERAKFVSPMALYLFTVFLMFAVFGFTGGALLGDHSINTPSGKVAIGDWRAGIRAEYDKTQAQIDRLDKQRVAASAAEKPQLDKKIAELIDQRDGMAALATGDWSRLAALDKRTRAREVAAHKDKGVTIMSGNDVRTGWTGFDSVLNKAIAHANENPSLLLYKLKTSGYKYSWLLIPLSIPFLWMLFFWRRDVHLYDHAIFTTYSISFMMVLVIILSILAAFGLSAIVWGPALLIVPPLHMYKQLRTAYGPSSRIITLFRLNFLLVSTIIVALLFTLILVGLGVIG